MNIEQEFNVKVKEEPAVEFECHLPMFQSDRTLGGKLIKVKRKMNLLNLRKSKEFTCEICQKKFNRKDSLKRHYPTHQKQTCQVCNREI
jgi:hypothetical protein